MSPIAIGLCFGIYLVVGYFLVVQKVEKDLREMNEDAKKHPRLFSMVIALFTLGWLPFAISAFVAWLVLKIRGRT